MNDSKPKESTKKPVEMNAFLFVGSEMFEGKVRLTSMPKFDDNFPAPGAIYTCKNSKIFGDPKEQPVVGELSPLSRLSNKQAREFLLDAGFVQSEKETEKTVVENYAPELEVVATTE